MKFADREFMRALHSHPTDPTFDALGAVKNLLSPAFVDKPKAISLKVLFIRSGRPSRGLIVASAATRYPKR